jgi:hypothetical protein
VLFGSGAAVTLTGFIVASNNVLVDVFTAEETVKGTGALIAGLSLMAGSVPFFIMANKNRRRSIAITGFGVPLPPAQHSYFSLRQGRGLQLTFTQKLF